MRQSEFRVEVTKKSRYELTVVANAAFLSKNPLVVGRIVLREAWKQSGKVHFLSVRRKCIRTSSFNASVLRNLGSVKKFKFKKKHIGTVFIIMAWKAGKNRKTTLIATQLQRVA